MPMLRSLLGGVSSPQPVGPPMRGQPIPYQGPGIPYTPGYGGPPVSGSPVDKAALSNSPQAPMPVDGGTPQLFSGGGSIGEVAGGWPGWGWSWGAPSAPRPSHAGPAWGQMSPTGAGAPFQQTGRGQQSSYGSLMQSGGRSSFTRG
jgi:hypothetical protein